MPFLPSQALSSEIEVDLDEHRIAMVGKHEIESSDINRHTATEGNHGIDTFGLFFRPTIIVDPPAPADVIVKSAVTDPEIAHGQIAVDHHPQIPAAMIDPALQQRGLSRRELADIADHLIGRVYGEDSAATSTRIAFEHHGIIPRRAMKTEMLHEARRAGEKKTFRMAHSQFSE